LLFLFNMVNLRAQIEGTEFKNALIEKEAELHYIFSNAPGFSDFQHGRLVGICVDIMADFEFFLLDKYGIRTKSILHKEFVDDFPTFLMTVENAKYGSFGLSNVTKTKKRATRFQFSPPFIRNYAVMLSNDNIAELSSLTNIPNEFSGLKALTVKGSTNEEQLLALKNDFYPNLEIDYVPNFNEVLYKVSEDEHYFTIIDFIYLVEANRKNLSVQEHRIGVQEVEELAFILPMETDWNIPLNKFLTTEYKMSQSYRKIIVRHLGLEALRWLDEMDAVEAILKANK